MRTEPKTGVRREPERVYDLEQLDRAEIAAFHAVRREHYAEVWEMRQRIYGKLSRVDASINRYTGDVNDPKVFAQAIELVELARALAALCASKAERKTA